MLIFLKIIHLHDCLRGALGQLQKDVSELYRVAALKLNGIKSYSNKRENLSDLTELERKIAARFKVIWSVFKAHSSAEDEFIWPALKCKLNVSGTNVAEVISERSLHDKTKNMQSKTNLSHSAPISDSNLQDEYEKDHEKEEVSAFVILTPMHYNTRYLILGVSIGHVFSNGQASE